MRDWLKAFRPASFRGVPFKVDGEGMAGQRRLSVSPIAYADASVIEDMGRDPMVFRLTAYTVGDEADHEARALASALSDKGAALLILPMQGAVRARAQDWNRDRRKDFAGHIAFSISFIEEGLGSVPFGAAAGAGPVADLLAAGGAILGAALNAAFAGLSGARQSPELRDVALAETRIGAAATTTMTGDRPAVAVTRALTAFSEASASAIEEPETYALSLADGWRLVALNADPMELRAHLTVELLRPVESPAGIAEQTAIAGALAIASVRGDYAARPDARRARESMAASVAPVLASAGAALGHEAQAWLSEMTGTAAMILSRTAADRSPLVRVETMLSLSAVTAAYKLYGDANRARELVDRNRVATAVFLPVTFEALAS